MPDKRLTQLVGEGITLVVGRSELKVKNRVRSDDCRGGERGSVVTN